MSVTVLASTPALPPVGRKTSMWGKMFGNYKLGSEVVPMEDSGMLSPSLPVEKTRMVSVSTGIEQKSTIYNRKASTMSTMAKDSRTVSESSSSKNRAFSISSRRSSKNSIRSWFRSANPDTDANVPAMPTMDRKFSQFSMFSSHNPDSESSSPAASPTASRRPSYVPRNAASSFLRTTTPLSTDEKAEVSRRASVAEQLPTPNLALKARSVSSPVRANKPAPLLFTSAPAEHGLHSMEGACDIDDSDLVSPRGTTFSVASAPHSPADTIMEDPIEHQVDSAKASPELNPTKNESTVNVVELTC
ncbi:hypothetical protein M436DRAFT_82062 [Aureobasidium namibiae CBS 147.97]|uniref:Uncharacterized protein n=1 Tax=Aureobasidium namibiae CBS 147.97 TaxID=1043004 RepID=A0A074WI93_9PEZI